MSYSGRSLGFALSLAVAALNGQPLAAGGGPSRLRTQATAVWMALALTGVDAGAMTGGAAPFPAPAGGDFTPRPEPRVDSAVLAREAVAAYRADHYPTVLAGDAQAAGVAIETVLAPFRTRGEISRQGWAEAQGAGAVAGPLAGARARRLTLEMDFEVIAVLEAHAEGRSGPRSPRRHRQLIELQRLALEHEISANERQLRALRARLLLGAKGRRRAQLLEACNDLMRDALWRYREHAEDLLVRIGEETPEAAWVPPARAEDPDEARALPRFGRRLQ